MKDLEPIDCNGWTAVRVTSKSVKKAIACVEEGLVQGFIISDTLSEKSLEALAGAKQCLFLSVSLTASQIASSIEKFRQLECLLTQSPLPLNLASFSKLKKVRLVGHKNLVLPDETNELSKVSIFGPKFEPRNLQDLSRYSELRELSIRGGNTISLQGIEGLQQLEHLYLSHLPKLATISGIELTAVQSISLFCCPNISDLTPISKALRLEAFHSNRIKSIPSLGFLKNAPALKSFTFDNTNILDGDLSPLERLEYVYFKRKPHYSHKLTSDLKLVRV